MISSTFLISSVQWQNETKIALIAEDEKYVKTKEWLLYISAWENGIYLKKKLYVNNTIIKNQSNITVDIIIIFNILPNDVYF